MKLTLQRMRKTDTATIGKLTVDGVSFCDTLEDVVRANGEKVYGQTAIPAGYYEVVMTFSNRFQKLLPLLLNVPNFTGVRIHAGNKSTDTEGCLLVGVWDGKASDFIGASRVTFAKLMSQLAKATKTEKIHIEIKDMA